MKTKGRAKTLVYTVPEAGQLLGLSRNAAYEAAKRGDIPTLRMGRLLRVPKGPFHKLVGAEVESPPVAEPGREREAETATPGKGVPETA